MAQINNREVLKRIEQEAFVSPAAEQIPNQLSNNIVPILKVNPKPKVLIKHAATSVTGNTTVHTTSSTKNTYLLSATLSFSKDVTCDYATSDVVLFSTVDGLTKDIMKLATLTLTAERGQLSLVFNEPLLLDKNVGVSIGTGAFTAGALRRSSSITYYEEDTF